jgi:hypothetical protein
VGVRARQNTQIHLKKRCFSKKRQKHAFFGPKKPVFAGASGSGSGRWG